MFKSISLLFLGLSFCFATNAEITVTVDGYTYYCSENGGGTDCSKRVAQFNEVLHICINGNGGQSATWCVRNQWPKFKERTPECVADGISTCIKHCTDSKGGQSATWCVQYCE